MANAYASKNCTEKIGSSSSRTAIFYLSSVVQGCVNKDLILLSDHLRIKNDLPSSLETWKGDGEPYHPAGQLKDIRGGKTEKRVGWAKN